MFWAGFQGSSDRVGESAMLNCPRAGEGRHESAGMRLVEKPLTVVPEEFSLEFEEAYKAVTRARDKVGRVDLARERVKHARIGPEELQVKHVLRVVERRKLGVEFQPRVQPGRRAEVGDPARGLRRRVSRIDGSQVRSLTSVARHLPG